MNREQIEEKAAQAAELRKKGLRNCTQVVTEVLAEETGLSPEIWLQLSSGFAAGMGSTKATCGSLIGAVMAAGMKKEGKGTVIAARQISESFEKKCGALKCMTLKGLDDKGVYTPCEECVRNAVRAYYEVMNDETV